MRLRILVPLLAVFVTATTFAETKLPLLRVGLEWYTNVTVTSVTASDVYFKHSQGIGNAKLKSLDPATQKLLGFDAGKSAEAEKRQADANAAYRAQLNNPAKTPRPAAKPEVRSETQGEPAASGDIIVPKLYARSVRGQPAPRMVIEKWLTQKPELAGKFILIDFWATWCGPCRRSIPEINNLHARFKDRLVVIGLSDEEEDEVRSMKTPKIDYTVAIDRSANMMKALAVTGIPHAIIIDPKGIVRFEGMPTYLNERNVAALLAKYSN